MLAEPRVFLISRPSVCREGLEQFLQSEGIEWESDAGIDALEIPEVAGRLCYMSFAKPRPGGNKAYIENILQARHGSVIEHSNWGIVCTGVSRSLTHELVRHRTAAYSQLSQRYVDESTANFVLPELIEKHEDLQHIWEESVRQSRATYQTLVSRLMEREMGEATKTEKLKAVRQAARSVLPNATETKIFMTANARTWRHVLEMRTSRHADAEIRRLFNLVFDVLAREAPGVFGDYTVCQLPDGTYEL